MRLRPTFFASFPRWRSILKKQRFTLDQHISIGAVLRTIYKQLTDIEVDVCRAYPKSGPEKRNLYKAIHAVSEARSNLEDRMFEEDHAGADTHVYYGPALRTPPTQTYEKINEFRGVLSLQLERVEDATHRLEDTARNAEVGAEVSKLRELFRNWPHFEVAE
jgi:hypothetical protein